MTSYSIVQKQQLSQLGAYLQEKRQEQGKSLEDISLQTYIRTQLLKSLENGDPSDLPQPIFVQGFIRRYADALGLDGTNFAKQFPVHSIPDTPRPISRPATPIELVPPVIAKKPPVQKKQSNQPEPRIGALPVQTAPARESMGVAKQPVSADIAPTDSASAKAEASQVKDFTLDPTPMSDSELATVGLSDTVTGIGTQISTDAETDVGIQNPNAYQSAPFSKETTPEIAAPEVTPESPLESTLESSPESTLESPSQQQPATQPKTPPSAPVAPPMPVEPATPIRASLSNEAPTSTVNWLPWGIGAAFLVGAIALIGSNIGGNSNQPAEPPDITTSQTTEPDVAQTPPPEIEAPEPEVAPVSSAPVSITIEITEAGPSWMSIEVDGEFVFEGLMDPGMTETWEGQESITMNVGNAGAALISANGGEPTPAGNPGGAEFLTFTAEE